MTSTLPSANRFFKLATLLSGALLNLCTTTSSAQKKAVLARPLILQGRLTDCPEKYLFMYYDDKNGQQQKDSIALDNEGKFYFKTYKVTTPQRVSLQRNRIQIKDLFIAPGYNLTITGQANDFATLVNTTKITGIGAESNNYRAVLHSVTAKTPEPKWYQMKENELLAFIKSQRKTKDSVADIVFNKPRVTDGFQPNLSQDRYTEHFKKMVYLDNEFLSLYYLLAYVNVNPKRYNDYEKAAAFLKDNADNNLLKRISKDEYLISNDYKNWIVTGEYTDYMIKLDYLRDSTLRTKKGYRLNAMSKLYTGKVKELALYDQMTKDIAFAATFDRLNYCREMFRPYVEAFANASYKKAIEQKYAAKEKELLRTLTGKPAPLFTLENQDGTQFNLADFKGKVVYLDLWASWCGPCREETPAFKKLYAKYKDDNRVAFISIAVNDGKAEWKKALAQDKPTWLQLLDKDAFVARAYVSNMIPKFIVIDKQGNIVNFDAPRPSDGKVLENLLTGEMGK